MDAATRKAGEREGAITSQFLPITCGASKNAINHSGCLADLDAFNNSQDTVATTPPPFDAPGPAQPSECQDANGNGIVIGKRCF